MKKLPVIILMLWSFKVLGQQTSAPPEVMQMKFPAGTQKVDTQQFRQLTHMAFSGQMNLLIPDHLYKKDGLLIYYTNLSTIPKNRRSVESAQRQTLGVFQRYGKKTIVVDTSKIISVNNILFSIIEFHENNYWYFRFTSDTDKNTAWVNGVIEFKKSDEEKAVKYLQELLQGMHFKK